MKEIIEQTLGALIGLPLRDAARASSLEWFEFGSKLTKITLRNGKTSLVGEYVIDTESAWHILGPNGVVVGSGDRPYPAGEDPHKDLLHFDWDRPGANRCDERMRIFLADHKDSPLRVESLAASNWGGLRINLSAGHVLEIFPDSSLDYEYWRFYEPWNEEKHFVITAHGIEY